jgi:hypothetical protein
MGACETTAEGWYREGHLPNAILFKGSKISYLHQGFRDSRQQLVNIGANDVLQAERQAVSCDLAS